MLFFFNVMWTVYLFGAEVTKVYVDYLVHGDIQQPSVRAQARRLTALTLDEPEAIGAAGSSVAAFLAGFVIAWFGRRRAS